MSLFRRMSHTPFGNPGLIIPGPCGAGNPAQCHSVFAKLGFGIIVGQTPWSALWGRPPGLHCGADPLVCAGRPRPALLTKNRALATIDKPARILRGYNWAPVARFGEREASFFRNSRLRSRRASLLFRSRWKRALSPLRADMVVLKSSRVCRPAYAMSRKAGNRASGRRRPFLLLDECENIEVASRAVREKAVHGILLVCENFEYRVQLCQDHQIYMERAEMKQLQRPARGHDPCVTEDQCAQPVSVNVGHAREVEDDVHNFGFHQCGYRVAQDRFRRAFDQVSVQIENPNPLFLALMELEVHGSSPGMIATSYLPASR